MVLKSRFLVFDFGVESKGVLPPSGRRTRSANGSTGEITRLLRKEKRIARRRIKHHAPHHVSTGIAEHA
eukprot:2104192-Rhodomonas_salina.4